MRVVWWRWGGEILFATDLGGGIFVGPANGGRGAAAGKREIGHRQPGFCVFAAVWRRAWLVVGVQSAAVFRRLSERGETR